MSSIDHEPALRQCVTIPPQAAEAFYTAEEKRLLDIKPGLQKQIIWAGDTGQKTKTSIVYIHGFSASLQELRPVPDLVAEVLRANLVYMRLRGHAQPGREMGRVTSSDWLEDFAQAMSVARAIGEEVLIMGSSTGATIATYGLTIPEIAQSIRAVAYFAPNFEVRKKSASLAYLPGFDTWGPMVARNQQWKPRNKGHARFWTSRYPTQAITPMMEFLKEVKSVKFNDIMLPAFFMFSDKDRVVNALETHKVMTKWGGRVHRLAPKLLPTDDPNQHVIAGDVVSPSQSRPAAGAVIKWYKGL